MIASVRPAQPSDMDAIVRLEREIATAPHWSEAEYARIATPEAGEAARRCLLVACVGEQVVGFAVGAALGHEAELESVAVAAAHRHRGVGRELCLAVIAWCAERGASAVELEARAGSAEALRLYERLGFVATGRRAAYYRNPDEDAVQMRLDPRVLP